MPGRFDGVIFDMDGTLVEMLLDFAAIRAELGIGPEQTVIAGIDAMPPARARRAHRRLRAMELAAARRARLMPWAVEAVEAARAAGMKVALLTNNCLPAMRTVLRRFGGLRFDLAWSRERCAIKPGPDGVLAACRALGVAPGRTACVGDFRYDILAAGAAGAVSVLVRPPPRPGWADQADFAIADLRELPRVLGI